ncbi:hypothetical protein C8R44DRAFT_930608 [Mycena epipterygia]|nr:hypothetical protein C8R44DRAFT_930608 [Mycena epipterygia]
MYKGRPIWREGQCSHYSRIRTPAMPTLPSSQLPAPSSPITLVGFIVFVLVVVCGSGLYLFGLHLHDKLVRASDIESQKAAGAVSVFVDFSGKPASVVATTTKTAAAAAALVAARAHLSSICKMSGPIKFIVSSAASERKKCSRPGPSPLRAVIYVPETIVALVVVQWPVMESPLSTTLDNFVLPPYHTAGDSDSDSDSDDELTQFDGLRMVRSTVDSWIPVHVGSRKVKVEPVILAPPVLNVSCTANTPLRRAVYIKRPSASKVKRPSVNTRCNKENSRPIQSPHRALLSLIEQKKECPLHTERVTYTLCVQENDEPLIQAPRRLSLSDTYFYPSVA